MNRDELELAMGPGAHVFIHNDEFESFQRYLSAAQVIVIIGSAYGGADVLALMYAAKTARVHGIDPFRPDPYGGWQASENETRIHVEYAAKQLKFDPSRWVLHVAESHDVAREAAQLGAWTDFVFVDGDHAYEAVRQDVEDWLPLLKAGGVLALHDSRRVDGTPEGTFNRGWPGPTQVANELLGDRRVALIEDAYSFTFWRKS